MCVPLCDRASVTSMQQCGSLEELAIHFEARLSMLKQCLHLQGHQYTTDTAGLLGHVQTTLRQLEADLAAMRAELKVQQGALDITKVCEKWCEEA